mgnify:CR=1 FL=1
MKSTTCSSKGVGTTMGTIMLMVIFLIFFGVYLYMVNNHVQSTIQLNLESSQILKLKSTFSLFNASLGNTWFISTVQAIFMTGDESIGCGTDDPLAERLPDGYWYMRDPNQGRDGLTDSQGRPIERIPSTLKYNENGLNPQICYPRDIHVLTYLQNKLECDGLLNLKTPMDAGGVAIVFDSVRSVCNGNSKAVSNSPSLNLNDDNIESKFSQSITATYGDGRIVAQTENYNKVMTSFRQMVAKARAAIGNLLTLGDAHEAYAGLQYTQSTNKVAYENRVKSFVETILTTSMPTGVLATADIQTDMRAADATVSSVMYKGSGLVVHYSATAIYTEGATQVSNTLFSWPTNSRKLNSCYGFRKLDENDPGRFHMGIDIVPDGDETVNAVGDGVVVDTYNECPVGALGSLCGGPGSEKYGNMVLIKHANYYSFYAHLKKDSIMVAKGDSIGAGQQIAVMGSSGSSTGVHLHFELRTQATAGSAVNPCTLIDCTQSTDKKCDTINTLTQPTPGVYYYNDENANAFVKRPIRLEYIAEDYMPALDCAKLSSPIAAFTWLGTNDMLCCAGNLFSCNADIPGLDSAQELTTGMSIQDTNPPTALNYCNNILSGTMSCTANGFVLS